jgi:radical SAM protein with 4Fe4S-binding SPASM domain
VCIAVPKNPRRSAGELTFEEVQTLVQCIDYAQLKGKCGVCEFKSICGGSRARAYALTGDPMHSDPYCIYQPAAWRERRLTAKPQLEPRRRHEYLQ